MRRFFLIFSFFFFGILGGLLTACGGPTGEDSASPSVVNGVQVIEIFAKGGFSPRKISAEAGIPTLLKVETNGTYDCSASLVIPKLRYQKLLPSTGVEEIELSAEEAQGTFTGLCGMGMYSFEVTFE